MNTHCRHYSEVKLFLKIIFIKNTFLYPKVLKDHRVPEEHVMLINLFCTPSAARRIVAQFPKLNILTTEVHDVTPNHFGEKYFGTDRSEF